MLSLTSWSGVAWFKYFWCRIKYSFLMTNKVKHLILNQKSLNKKLSRSSFYLNIFKIIILNKFLETLIFEFLLFLHRWYKVYAIKLFTVIFGISVTTMNLNCITKTLTQTSDRYIFFIHCTDVVTGKMIFFVYGMPLL
jgi:hypothetical protein